MALAELICTAVPWQGWTRYEGLDILTLIDKIVFEEYPRIVFHSGMSVEVGNLDALLESLIQDFRRSTRYPQLVVGWYRGKAQLELHPLMCNWRKDLTLLDTTIRSMVATHTLSGVWDEGVLAEYNAFGRTTAQLTDGADEFDPYSLSDCDFM